jgi:hypothetical protein
MIRPEWKITRSGMPFRIPNPLQTRPTTTEDFFRFSDEHAWCVLRPAASRSNSEGIGLPSRAFESLDERQAG